MAYGGGAWVQVWNTSGRVCTSRDGGETFALAADFGVEIYAPALWTGATFLIVGAGTTYESRDGLSWEPTGSSPAIGELARNPETGTIVGLDRGAGYAALRLYRSTDEGASFVPISSDAIERSHGLFFVVFGYGDPSTMCP